MRRKETKMTDYFLRSNAKYLKVIINLSQMRCTKANKINRVFDECTEKVH